MPIYKLRILDALIDRLSRGRKMTSTEGLSESVDARIERFTRKLHAHRAGGHSWAAGLSLETGTIVDLVA